MADLGSIGRTRHQQKHTPQWTYPAWTVTRIHAAPGLHNLPIQGTPAHVAGTVTRLTTPTARTVRAYRRDTGALIGETTSDPITGAFDLPLATHTGTVYVLALDDASADPRYNAEILDLITPAAL